ncbi:MAG TPA: hypothetical protein VGP82_11835 [Ktedonobacterales bacterium]|nr:hypothetical protein [Ktedonobacterales bacterium]
MSTELGDPEGGEQGEGGEQTACAASSLDERVVLPLARLAVL